jgi:uncharacterized damage-inducible protein DinB
MGMRDVHELVQRLEDSMKESFGKIESISSDYVDQPCRHGCARGGTVWHLLTHNIEHERMHTGQIVGVRDAMKRLQQDKKYRLLAELYVARAMLVASLIDLEDNDIDQAPIEGGWTIREIVEHVIYWDRDSIDDLQRQFVEESSATERQ